MIEDPTLMKAVSAIMQRSERQQDLEKLIRTFVDVGVLPQIENLNNQVIYGRRGTGKTHVFKVLASNLEKSPSNIVCYIDARTLGSTAQFSDSSISLKQRCVSLFRDILGEMYNGILDHIVNNPPADQNDSLDALNDFGQITTELVSRQAEGTSSVRALDRSTGEFSGELKADIREGVSIGTQGISQSQIETETTQTVAVVKEDKIIFPALNNVLQNLLKKIGVNLYILFDEWSSLPIDIQPYLAEFFKRGVIPNPHTVLKIASLEYRSNFGIVEEQGIIGFELGSDISTSVDIDDYYVYDRNPSLITLAFAEMLLKHLSSELPEDYLKSKYKIKNGEDLASKMFTTRNTFEELVRASEGVARDLINIFTTAYFDSQRRGLASIDKKAVLEAARQWFEKDKHQNLDEKLQNVLQSIVTEVIGHRKARSFLLPRDLEKNSIIQRLFDSRVLHLMHRGYADKVNPGTRYNIYTLDYGTYVDMMNTSSQPNIEFIDFNGDDQNLVVPFDDKRSIRRVILTKDSLED